MKDFAIALALLSFLLLATGMVFKKNKQSIFSEPIIGLVAGILLGPYVFNVLRMQEWGAPEKIMIVASQITISMALMATAFRVPKGYFLKNKSTQLILVFIGMAGMCAASTLLIKWIFGFDWMLSFLIGAVITPTDPVIASTIVSGETAKKLLPDRIRHAISFESGANDGLAYPFVLLPLLFLENEQGAFSEWFLSSFLWATLGGIVFGLLIGYGTTKLLLKAMEAEWTAKPVLLAFSLSLGFFVLGLLEMIHCNGIIGVFCAGFVANHVLSKREDIEQQQIQESTERLFTLPIFFLLGLLLPWQEWLLLGWKAVFIVVAVLLFRRLPVLLCMMPLLKKFSKKDVLFLGWFGPIGVAALYYAMHSVDKIHFTEIWTITSLIVFSSTIVHGTTGYPFAKWYQKQVAAHEMASSKRGAAGKQ